ncbi:Orotate phosphoribosyltransferase [Schizosaccharomyces pombe]|uniref:Orotate phosphoribosyltransferase n=1 Tax=Schizosaccharomyces pombe (strain 972 / ATCC 24843) TaxID=284812 RepID=PYRE_SCHPO|nr:orotate phosphoribosyltransferase Ura5 [Schizosaccharomyces pombe]O94331.1 RecName: Full=Orotate phosphoribosyltransferase; Short=OPRT; Short=OPRTase [Schizosaccharomyces pombe 972h-]CAA22187.1 orotate phosphoribosyltransferase Ura5 [Schizosaccharomyces pombe]|eukprot:NP_595495.1 orotate phosphoribosyltransferase Ura5 [Schizosaccharomyces pombe]
MSYKLELLRRALEHNVLKFGTFTLKSGRKSPYFFNSGNFTHGADLCALAEAYAETIIAMNVDFDVIFGPAYKGISLAAITAVKLYEKTGKSYGFAYNRKEAKSHGEGGNLVGAEMEGKKVLLLDDVITAGTAIREAISFLEPKHVKLAGIVLLLDRQERLDPEVNESTIGRLKKELNLPVSSILTLDDIVDFTKSDLTAAESKAMDAYRQQYQAK